MKIHLLHVNDVHSQLENYMRLGHQLRTLRDELRQRGEPVLTLDQGDLLDRVRPETEATLGMVNAAMMASLQVDAWVFGNNEGLTIPVAEWPTLVDRAHVTALASNFRQRSGASFPFFKDFLVQDLNGIRVGLFAVTANYVQPYRMLGVQALDPVRQAHAMVQKLRHEACDLIVVMSHLGLREDLLLAQEVQGIDLILGGHTHQFMQEPQWVHRTAVFQPGKHALVFGHTEIEFDEATKSVVQVSGTPIAVDLHGPLDQEMLSNYRGYLPEIEERLSEVVVELTAPLPVWFERESLFANVLVDALYTAYPCDIAIMMTGALTASLLAGKVEVRHLLGACSTPTRPLMMTLTGAEIMHILNQSIRAEYFAKPGFGYGFRGSVVGYLALANAQVELVAEGESLRVQAVTIGGQILNPQQDYRVVTSEYLWLAPVFVDFQQAREIEFKQPLVRELLLDYLQSKAFLGQVMKARYIYSEPTDTEPR